ncbi:MAG: DUF1365 domain-containing protein [Coriobacteriia bacterium]|nr:DUF1365 domain-containing protein [Coriobacteriia bacterium]
MISRVFEGHVAHERLRPRRNRFRYRAYMLYLDLDELGSLPSAVRRFRLDRFGWISFYNSDHGPRDGSPLRPWVERLLASAGVDLRGGPVRILAFPRGLWFRFYPVAFWYCFHADGTLRAVMAEVHNTFGGRHNYLMHRAGAPIRFSEDLFATKVFHVSPFIGMDARYRFRFTEPGDGVSVSIHEDVEGEPLLIAGFSGRARPLADDTLADLARRYGPLPLRIWLLIHFQAIRLFAKRIRFHHDPGLPKEETSLVPQ